MIEITCFDEDTIRRMVEQGWITTFEDLHLIECVTCFDKVSQALNWGDCIPEERKRVILADHSAMTAAESQHLRFCPRCDRRLWEMIVQERKAREEEHQEAIEQSDRE